MALSLAIIILLGLLFNKTFDKMKLSGILGMLLLGVLIGPYGLNIICCEMLTISPELRKMALIVILLMAGLGLKKDTLKSVGMPAVRMSFLPGIFEGFTVMFAAHYFLDIPYFEAGMLGFILAAVSPAVIVPEMIRLNKEHRGTASGIPTLILASASVDDVVAITFFTSFLTLYREGDVNFVRQILTIPTSIIAGILLGVVIAFILLKLFRKISMRDTKKALIILGSAIVLVSIEEFTHGILPLAAYIGVMAIGFVIQEKYPSAGQRLSIKFGKIWIFAQLLLFVLVGAEVNVHRAAQVGLMGLLIIFIGLIARSIGVLLSLCNTRFNWKEKLFCVTAYIPKATVQAAIGAIPLTAGVASGEIILSIAVLAIMVTAPLGAMLIRIISKKWLTVDGSG
jgi:solute carrier family 9B (sodium/hydrogen exchanger), member 1/2